MFSSPNIVQWKERGLFYALFIRIVLSTSQTLGVPVETIRNKAYGLVI